MNERAPITIHGFEQTVEKDPATGVYSKPVHWVIYSPNHAAQYTTIRDRVDRMRPPEAPFRNDDEGKRMDFLRMRWRWIEPRYEAWKKGVDLPEDGTPLAMWPAIGHDHIRELQKHGYNTVERVADIPDNMFQHIALPNCRELRKQARLFLENIEKTAAANKIAEQDRKLAAMEEQLAAAMALLEEQAKKEQKPHAGRRGKQAAHAEEVEEAA